MEERRHERRTPGRDRSPGSPSGTERDAGVVDGGVSGRRAAAWSSGAMEEGEVGVEEEVGVQGRMMKRKKMMKMGGRRRRRSLWTVKVEVKVEGEQEEWVESKRGDAEGGLGERS